MWRAHESDDPAVALASARTHLESEPLAHNLVMTLLQQRIDQPEPGRYWWVTDDTDDVVAFVLQSPTSFKGTATPASRTAIEVVVDAVLSTAPDMPGVIAEAATAACFAGVWAERTKAGAHPEEGQRLYELTEVVPPVGVAGSLRAASPDDAALLVEWNAGFCRDTGQPSRVDPARWVDDLIAHGRVFVWDLDEPVSTAIVTDPIVGVARVGFVYTPPDQRGRGYAAAVTAGVSDHALRHGADRCMLYTQLSNPTSNAVYQRLGYRAVSEVLAYRFGNESASRQ